MDVGHLKNYLKALLSITTKLGCSLKNDISKEECWNWDFLTRQIHNRAIFLKAISQQLNIKINSIAEIGVYRGATSKLFRFLFPKAKLYLIDPWEIYSAYLEKEAGPISTDEHKMEEVYGEVKKHFRRDKKCKIIRKMSSEAVKNVPDELDLVFIDGNHSYEYVKEDIKLWLPKVRAGGILSGHDYDHKLFPGVVKAVDELLQNKVSIGFDTTWYHIKK
jgi:hypothetical protein